MTGHPAMHHRYGSTGSTLAAKQKRSAKSHAQNDRSKKISAWAAILFAPTLVGASYGMNFERMPD